MYTGGVNFTSLLFMNVYRIYITLLFDLTKRRRRFFLRVYLCPFVDELTKRGEVFWSFIYACCISFSCFIQKGGKDFWDFTYACLFFSINIRVYMFCLCKKGRNIPHLGIYALFCLWVFIAYLYVYCYAWVKGELLWTLTLIHAYITPWVLSSSKSDKKGEIVDPEAHHSSFDDD